MNYGKKGVNEKQKALNSKSTKWGKKFLLICLKVVLIFIISGGIIGVSAGIGIFKGIIATAPDASNLNVSPTRFSTFVYDIEGNQTAKLVATNSNRIPVSMDMIPENLAHAFVAIEDERFYEHNGIDIIGIVRAGVKGVTSGFHFSEGASTITQQLLKNNVFTNWTSEDSFLDSLKRKIQEQYLALELEKTMDKDTILCNYMNTINLGQNTLGVQAASLRYFNKSVNELNLSECAVIASITQNPSRFNPITNPDKNAERRAKVLGNMLEQEYISQAEYDEAMADNVYDRIQTVNAEVGEETTNSYFVDALTEQLLEDLVTKAGYNETQAYTLLYSGGLKIYSTQDPKIQAICDEVYTNPESYPENTKWLLNYELTILTADEEYKNYSTEMFKTYWKEQGNSGFNLIYASQEDAYADIEAYKTAVCGSGDEVFAETISLTPQPQVSLTIEDQSTGYVVALVGGRGAKEGSRTLNRATDTVRQPGSTFKVLAAYAPAFDSAGLTLATVINDAPFNYTDGKAVRNWYGEEYRGLCSLRDGIKDSMNILAVKTITWITPQLGYDYLLNFGFTTLEENKVIGDQVFTDIHQSLSLGGITNGVKNIELNAAYATIANGGTYIEPKLYTKVVDQDGNVILDNTQPVSKQVIKETTAFLLTDAMADVVTSGTGGSVNFGNMAIAGKTGTTSDYNDVWFAGYTPYYTATTWAGYDNNEKLKSSAEKNLAKTLWKSVMSKIHEDLPYKSFTMPAGIVQATVCSRSGKLPIAGLCDGTLKTEYFAENTVPTASCDVHYQGMICEYSMLPACEQCPFKVGGTLELLPVEDISLQSGSATTVVNPDGTTTTAPVATTNMCPHSPEFFLQENAYQIIEAQKIELENRRIAAQQQQLLEQQQSEQPQQQPPQQ
ncbi:MAG: transglycosylase domain-containing protein [Lachnospiraceae bacterium]|nr:transglycosylase domain-containing protein [Lachnospiraceae bacterium]